MYPFRVVFPCPSSAVGLRGFDEMSGDRKFLDDPQDYVEQFAVATPITTQSCAASVSPFKTCLHVLLTMLTSEIE